MLLLFQICFCFAVGDLMPSLSDSGQTEIVEVLTPPPDVNGLLGIDGPYFEGMIDQIYRTEFQLNRAIFFWC